MMNTDTHSLNSNSDTDRDASATAPKRLGFVGAFTGDTHSHSAPVAPAIHNTYEAPHTDDLGTFEAKTTSDTVASQPPVKPELLRPKKPSSKKPLLGLLAVLVLMVGSGVGLYLVRQNQELRQQASSGDTVIATVGEEKIYQKDLDIELQYFPPIAEVDGQPTREYLLDKIILDSQVLQALGKTSDSSIYNNPGKDYLKRTDLVQDLLLDQQAKLMSENAFIKGKALTMWYNNQNYGNIPLAERKATVQQKINALREQVANGTLTIDQAIQQVRADSSLEVIDPSYKPNASYPFGLIQDSDLINRSESLTNEVKTLNVGDVSQVYDHSLSDNEQMFIFAVVNSKQAQRGSETKTLDSWLDEISKQYNVQKQ